MNRVCKTIPRGHFEHLSKAIQEFFRDSNVGFRFKLAGVNEYELYVLGTENTAVLTAVGSYVEGFLEGLKSIGEK